MHRFSFKHVRHMIRIILRDVCHDYKHRLHISCPDVLHFVDFFFLFIHNHTQYVLFSSYNLFELFFFLFFLFTKWFCQKLILFFFIVETKLRMAKGNTRTRQKQQKTKKQNSHKSVCCTICAANKHRQIVNVSLLYTECCVFGEIFKIIKYHVCCHLIRTLYSFC